MARVTGWVLWWLIGWADIFDGICWVMTGGKVQPGAGLRMLTVWMDFIEARKKGDE